MKIGKIFLIISFIFNENIENDCEKYKKLKINEVPSIKKSDLPSEFCDEAFKIVDEFIRKTHDLDYEILLYFDYIPGKIINCKIGTASKVELEFDDETFRGKHVASIHNHTKDMYSSPSDKNFGIFSREWEKYELISGIDGLWILKGKIKDKKLTFELKTNSKILFRMVLDYYSKRCKNINERNEKIDEEYGKLLSNYINNKNINEIQLQKKVYNNDQ